MSDGVTPQGSYVAVSGQPGRGSVHVVESVPALGRDSVTVTDVPSVHDTHVHGSGGRPTVSSCDCSNGCTIEELFPNG